MSLRLVLFLSLQISGFFGNNELKKIIYNINEVESIFAKYISKFEKNYGDKKEYETRFEIFKKHLLDFNELNAKYPDTTFGINEFTDITFEEFRKSHMGLIIDDIPKKDYIPARLDQPPETLDYREKGYVTNIKDQKNCGACYVFSAIGMILIKIKMYYNNIIHNIYYSNLPV